MKIVLLDRDGVINKERESYIKSASEWEPLEGSIEAIAALYQAGFKIFVITNQSGLARGFFDSEALDAMHEKMCAMVVNAGAKISQIYYCPHHPDDLCNCRKPATGMLEQLMREHQCTLDNAYFVGDTIKDIGAAKNIGATPILVETGKGKTTAASHDLTGVTVYADLLAASHAIIDQQI
jgi:D-glycero-D-manno-heptose 1,7-bisphosphate phosphatase